MANKNEEQLRRELEATKALLAEFQKQGTTLRVSPKGGVSVYGINRYPVTLYKSQWRKLLAMADTIKEFLVENDARLPEKAR